MPARLVVAADILEILYRGTVAFLPKCRAFGLDVYLGRGIDASDSSPRVALDGVGPGTGEHHHVEFAEELLVARDYLLDAPQLNGERLDKLTVAESFTGGRLS